jgi:hypothetical protein
MVDAGGNRRSAAEDGGIWRRLLTDSDQRRFFPSLYQNPMRSLRNRPVPGDSQKALGRVDHGMLLCKDHLRSVMKQEFMLTRSASAVKKTDGVSSYLIGVEL